MRICLYTATALPKLGGQEAVVDSLARHFVRMGHEIVVLAPQPRSRVRMDHGSLPYAVQRHPRFYSTQHLVSWYRHFLMRTQARYRFDVIHCHDVYPTGYLAALCKPKLRVPLVITSHGGDVRDNNPRLSKRGIPERCVLALKSADALISIGPFTEAGFRRMYPPASNIVAIPNGIDLAVYATRAARPAGLDARIEEGKYALFLGRLAVRKGVDVLLEAMARVPADKGRVQLVIAGSGDEGSELEALASRLNVGDRVRFVGRVDGADKRFLLQNALFTVMPSRVWEAFPLVLLETYAAGRPVIGSAVPGITDLVREEETGLLVPEQDPPALARAITRLLGEPATADDFGKRAAEVARHYSWESVAAQHIELYERLIAGQRVWSAEQ